MSIPQKADKWIVFVLTFGFAAVNCRRKTLATLRAKTARRWWGPADSPQRTDGRS
jgi:hypothetical protein